MFSLFSHQILIRAAAVHSWRSLTGMYERCPWSEAQCAVLASYWLTYFHAAFCLAENSSSFHGKFHFCVTFSVVIYLFYTIDTFEVHVKSQNMHICESRTTWNKVQHLSLRSGLIFCSLLLCRERLWSSPLNIHFLIISKLDARCNRFSSHKLNIFSSKLHNLLI